MSETGDNFWQFTKAEHGYGMGLNEMVALHALAGFSEIHTIADIARSAQRIPGAVGFTAHPDFESGIRYAHAVVWYTIRSPKNQSWPLYLFDRTEALKRPGEPVPPTAIAAAEAKVEAKMPEARQLVAAAGQSDITLPQLE